MTLAELREKRKGLLLAARDVCVKAEGETRDLTDDEKATIAQKTAEAEQLDTQIKAKEADESLRAQVKALTAGMEDAPPAGVKAADAKAIAQDMAGMLLESTQYNGWLKSVAPEGYLPQGARVQSSPPFALPNLLKAIGYKAPVTGVDATSAGAFVLPDFPLQYEPLGRRPRTLLDLIPRRRTTSDQIYYVIRQTTGVSQAVPVAEANVSTYSGATGEVSGQKPEGAMTFESAYTNVKTIAVWIPVTRRALSDAAQIRGIIEQELRDDVQEELEDQIYDGDGAGENFLGITQTPNVLTQAWDTDRFRTTRLAKLAVEVTGRSTPTAFVLHPNDWAEFELSMDGQNRYYYGGPMGNAEKQLWGLPVVTSQCVHEGVGIVADWRKCALWDREQATITMSDSHSDFFTRNLIAVLCELRAAFALIRPTAFCQFDLASGS